MIWMNYKRFSILAYTVSVLLVIGAIGFCYGRWIRDGKDYSKDQKKIQEVLDLPWKNFFPITDSEMDIVRDLSLDQPIFAHDLRVWRHPPKRGPLRINFGSVSRSKFQEATDILFQLQSDEDLEEDEIKSQLNSAKRSLGAAAKDHPDAPIILYNQGILYLWEKKANAAANFLERALEQIKRFDEKLKSGQYPRRQRLELKIQLEECKIATNYALGVARLTDGETAEALFNYRQAAAGLEELLYASGPSDGPYADLDSPWYFRKLSHTRLDTRALWNDLIAAYLSSPDYHYSQEKPEKAPDCASLRGKEVADDGNPLYRDYQFCEGLDRADSPYKETFERARNHFYEDDLGWGDEHVVWAFVNWANLTAYCDVNSYPALLYNASLLHIKGGSFQQAATLVSLAKDFSDLIESNHVHLLRGEETKLDEQINKLHIVAHVLVGANFEVGACGDIEDSDLTETRKLYRKLFPDKDKRPTFEPVHTCFTQPRQERDVDKWLFIHRWRKMLNEGDFDTFDDEFDRVIAEDGFSSFFQKWREEVLEKIGHQALINQKAYLERGYQDQAQFIHDFVLYSGMFNGRTMGQLSLSFGDYLKISFGVVLPFLILFAALFILAFWHSCHRALTETFRSAHRVDRKRHERTSS